MIKEIMTNELPYYDYIERLQKDGIEAIYFGDELSDEGVEWCVSLENADPHCFYEAWDIDTVSLDSRFLIDKLVHSDSWWNEVDEDEEVYAYLIRYAKGA